MDIKAETPKMDLRISGVCNMHTMLILLLPKKACEVSSIENAPKCIANNQHSSHVIDTTIHGNGIYASNEFGFVFKNRFFAVEKI